MAITPLAKKLRIQSGQRIMVINPPAGYLEKLGDLPKNTHIADASSEDLDFVQLFVKDISDLESYGQAAIKSLKYDGLLWLCYPKKSSKVKTDIS